MCVLCFRYFAESGFNHKTTLISILYISVDVLNTVILIYQEDCVNSLIPIIYQSHRSRKENPDIGRLSKNVPFVCWFPTASVLAIIVIFIANYCYRYCQLLLHLLSIIVTIIDNYCQFYRLVGTRQQVATRLLISLSYIKSVKIRLFATCHLQTCYNLLKQLVPSPWLTSFDNQLAASLLTTWNKLVVNKLSRAVQTHPDIGLLITSLFQVDVNRLIATRAFLAIRS